jgi:hypothetical protein
MTTHEDKVTAWCMRLYNRLPGPGSDISTGPIYQQVLEEIDRERFQPTRLEFAREIETWGLIAAHAGNVRVIIPGGETR